MRLQKIATPVITFAVIGAVSLVGYVTHDKWVPYIFPAKSGTKAGEAGKEKDGEKHGPVDRVKLSSAAQANLGLDQEAAVDVLIPEVYWRKVLIPGVVVDRPGESDRGVTSRVAGIVTEIKARPGDTVKAGDPLFTVQLASEFIQSTQTELAKSSKDLAAAIVKRDSTAKLVKTNTNPITSTEPITA